MAKSVSMEARRRFARDLRIYLVGRRSAREAAGLEAEVNPDCTGCADPALRDALGYTEAEWQELCGPRGLDCPVIA